LAYDGSQRASAALHSAAEFCAVTDLPLTVLHVNPREGSTEDKTLDEARHYLGSYGLRPTFLSLNGHSYEQIVECVKQRGHDLLFIGHTVIVGSSKWSSAVQQNTSAQRACPVFLSR
jgi:hypothetical protein